MAGTKSILKIISEFEDICNAHDQLRSFKYGEFLDIIKTDVIEYSLAHLNIRQASRGEQSISYVLEFSVMDKTFKDISNINYVESNTLQIWSDIYNIVAYSPRWQDIGIVSGIANPQKFRHKGDDEVTGWGGTINLEVYDEVGFCDVPVTGYDYENGAPQPIQGTATYQNSDQTFDIDIDINTIYVAPDITVTDSDGSTFTTPANKDVTCTLSSNDINLKGVFDVDVADMPQLTIDADSAGTYTSISDDGSSGSITLSVNGGGYSAFSSPLVLVATDTLDVKRTVSTASGYYKLTGTY